MPQTIDHEDLVGVVGQRLEAAKIAEYELDRRLLPDRNDLKVHARADALLRIRHGRAKLGAFLVGETFLNLRHHVGRQVVHKVGDLVSVEGLDGIDELVAIHGVDQGFTDAVVDLDENVTVGLALDEVPDGQTFVERQGLKNPGHVGRMEGFEKLPELGRSLVADGQRLVILVPLALHAAVVLVLILLKDLLHPLEGAGGLLRVADKVALAVMQLVVILQTVRHHLLRNT